MEDLMSKKHYFFKTIRYYEKQCLVSPMWIIPPEILPVS